MNQVIAIVVLISHGHILGAPTLGLAATVDECHAKTLEAIQQGAAKLAELQVDRIIPLCIDTSQSAQQSPPVGPAPQSFDPPTDKPAFRFDTAKHST